MRQRINFYYVLACMLFMCLTACDKNSPVDPWKDIPRTIQNDFSRRHPAAEIIKTSQYNSSDYCQIDFIDDEQNQASILYINETWERTCTQFEGVLQLPQNVQQTFEQAGYSKYQAVEAVYKTKQIGIEKELYTIHFLSPWKGSNEMTHNVLINDDGMLLETLRSSITDPLLMPYSLPQDHFDFIAEKYKGAEIRGYIYNWGRHEYFILHENILKYVFFRGMDAKEWGFWQETRYELPIDVKIPDNVMNVLKLSHPDFTYTNIYYIEAYDGNAYHFEDKNHEQELGYIIGEEVGLLQ